MSNQGEKRKCLLIGDSLLDHPADTDSRDAAMLRALRETGWSVDVLTFRPPNGNQVPEANEDVNLIVARHFTLRSLYRTINNAIRSQVGLKPIVQNSIFDPWITPAIVRGIEAIRKQRPDMLLSSSCGHRAHLIALALARWTHVPWACDVRQAWQAPRANHESLSPGREFIRWVTQRHIMRNASLLLCSSSKAHDSVLQRSARVVDSCIIVEDVSPATITDVFRDPDEWSLSRSWRAKQPKNQSAAPNTKELKTAVTGQSASSPKKPNPSPVTVISTVLNDPDGLRIMLESLANQTLIPDEVIVADGGSSQDALTAMTEIVNKYPSVKLQSGKRCNIAEGRNRAIRSATHEIIACIDAGCAAEPDWLEHIIAPFADREVDIVGGHYQIDPQTIFQEVAGLLTMPGALKPLNPTTFNPSARSIAFRKGVWKNAMGFPNWLYTAEDTLFDLKLRSLSPAPKYVLAANARVRWQPRNGWRETFRQFKGYARGEAHIGRGWDQFRYATQRYVALTTWITLAILMPTYQGWTFGAAAAAVALFLFVHPYHNKAKSIARQMHSIRSYGLTVLIGEWITLAQWLGFLSGNRQRNSRPDVYIERLRNYLGSDSADVEIPKWSLRAASPVKTLIVSWHWAPTSRASANVLSSLFKQGDSQLFRVLTRYDKLSSPEVPHPTPPIPVHRVDYALSSDKPVRFWTFLANVITAWRMVSRAKQMQLEFGAERVLAVFPHRYSLLAGYLIARRLDLPFVAYMHDLCGAGLLSNSTVKRVFWSWIEKKALREASAVFVPTEEFADYYRSKGVRACWVLPHTLPADVAPAGDTNKNRQRKRFVYSGAVYEAHEDAIRSLIQAVKHRTDIELTFQSNSHPLLRNQDNRWLTRSDAMKGLCEADVCVVALGENTPYPEEVRGCFPSKLVDYLAAGKPVLAIVPQGSYVDRMVREGGIGLSVAPHDQQSLSDALDNMADDSSRQTWSENAKTLARQLEPQLWYNLMLRKLIVGPERQSSDPPFPLLHPAGPSEDQVSTDEKVTTVKSELRAVPHS